MSPPCTRDTAYRVLADHLRTLSFAITDGAIPSNEGRGYVLRRILRRAVRYSMQTLGAKSGCLHQLVPAVIQHFSKTYPELLAKQSRVQVVIKEEEEAFAAMLEKGVKHFYEIIKTMNQRQQTVFDGNQAFYLYDTLGFPLDLTQIMVNEEGFTVDIEAFQLAMNNQQVRSREAQALKRLAGHDILELNDQHIATLQSKTILPTIDHFKYNHQDVQTTVVGIFNGQDGLHEDLLVMKTEDTIGIILQHTSFYAEAGGQVADTGKIRLRLESGEHVDFDVIDVQVNNLLI